MTLGIEDALFCFLAGGMAWLEAVWPFRRDPCWDSTYYLSSLRYLGCTGFLVGAFLLFYHSGISPMGSMIGAYVLLIGLILTLQKELWPLTVAAGLQGFVFYFFFLHVLFAIAPDFSESWKGTTIWHFRIWGIPLGEIAWAAFFTGSWPTLVAYSHRVTLSCRVPLKSAD